MDFGSETGFPDMGGAFNNWGVGGLNDQEIWATEDEYRNWNGCETNGSNYDSLPQFTSGGGGEPPNKRTRSSPSGDSVSNRAKAIGKMFYKTKLCCKFRAGVCPYVTNCNFAHGLDELRKPPPNWQDIVAAHDEERDITVEQREEHQIPTISTSDSRNESYSHRSYKGRHCKKFYTEEGCPYGDNCAFFHDEQSRARESVAISVSPTVGGTFGPNGQIQKHSNWKTRICNKWETTGSCPFGAKCHFAHGLEELHKFGGSVEGEFRDSVPIETTPSGVTTKADTVAAPSLSTPRQEYHHVGLGIPSQRPSSMSQVVAPRPAQKWKGPDKISRIYGDWIDDIE